MNGQVRNILYFIISELIHAFSLSHLHSLLCLSKPDSTELYWLMKDFWLMSLTSFLIINMNAHMAWDNKVSRVFFMAIRQAKPIFRAACWCWDNTAPLLLKAATTVSSTQHQSNLPFRLFCFLFFLWQWS